MPSRRTLRTLGRRKAVLLALLVAAIVIGVDQGLKALVVSEAESFRGGKSVFFGVRLVYVSNEGVAFGFLSGRSSWLIILITAVVVAAVAILFVFRMRTPVLWLGVGLVEGGALGNLVDRLGRGSVVDYVKLPYWPAFNFADVAVVAGVFAIAYALDGFRAGPAEDTAPRADD